MSKDIPGRKKNNYIVSLRFDAIHIIGAPLIAFLLAIPFSRSEALKDVFPLSAQQKDWGTALIAIFIMAHLFIVLFRSHANRKIFRLYPVRFIWIPLAIFLAAFFSVWAAVIFSVLATWWDVYHSSLQTFGFGRIYDSKQGNDPLAGRRLDYLFNLLLYIGPILAGASLMAHMNDFSEFKKVDSLFFQNIPLRVFNFRHDLQLLVFILGGIFAVVYIVGYIRLYRRGYSICIPKVILFLLTAIVSVLAWGLNSFGEAFFIMNFFHAWQYFAIVWVQERRTMGKNTRLANIPYGYVVLFICYLFIGLGYGLWAEVMPDAPAVFALTIMISLIHFWYDGFIWSVRKSQI